jgi:transcription initiation factor TFIIIB Brf1 subunit/transcription initiation factor TFIIB
MNCKHKNKTRLYKRMPTTWTSQDLWVCEDCGAVLGIAEIKIKIAGTAGSLAEKTKVALNVGDDSE